MSKAHSLGALLVRARRRQGFPTAYAFFRDRDGRRSLNISYRNYLFLEQGKSLPKVKSLEAILGALGLGERSPAAGELVDAYFSALGPYIPQLAHRLLSNFGTAGSADSVSVIRYS